MKKILNYLVLIFAISFGNSCTSNNQNTEKANTPNKNINRPNVLIILTDDQGYHDVSYYGTSDLKTPNIDALQSDGMRFDNFYANCPVCSPTRASLLTGRYPDHVGVPGVIRTYPNHNWGFLDTTAVSIADEFNLLGYHTSLIGKWHLGLESPNIPNDRGFDYFHGWLGDMMDDYWKKRRHEINYMRLNEQVIDPSGHATDIFTDWAVDYIEENKNGEDPFFMFLAYNAPHFPVQPPEEWLDKVKARENGISDKRAKLVAFIEHLDDGIGKVVQALKQSNQYDNTIIVFSSDNGGLIRDEANNGPLRDGKQSVYEGGLKVPTCVTWKDGGISAGSSSDYRALTMDLYPTLVEAAGGNVNHFIEGKSFLPVLKGQSVSDRDRPLYFVRREGGKTYGGLTIQAVLLNEWKLLQNSPFAPQELYNLNEDPYEQNDLSESKPEKFQELNALTMKFMQSAGKVPWQKPNE